jgi:hypothetical protein
MATKNISNGKLGFWFEKRPSGNPDCASKVDTGGDLSRTSILPTYKCHLKSLDLHGQHNVSLNACKAAIFSFLKMSCLKEPR